MTKVGPALVWRVTRFAAGPRWIRVISPLASLSRSLLSRQGQVPVRCHKQLRSAHGAELAVVLALSGTCDQQSTAEELTYTLIAGSRGGYK